MKEHSNDRDKAEQSAHQRKNRGKGRAKRVWGVIGTIMLVGVLTMAIFVGIFMTYINKSLKGHVEVDMSEYDRKRIHGAVPSGDGRRDMGDVSDAVQR